MSVLSLAPFFPVAAEVSAVLPAPASILPQQCAFSIPLALTWSSGCFLPSSAHDRDHQQFSTNHFSVPQFPHQSDGDSKAYLPH